MDVQETPAFTRWFARLRDGQAIARISARVDRLRSGHFGDHKTLPGGIGELRITTGPGYRVYYTQRGNTLIILLAGGDKSTQAADIARAQRLAKNF